MSQCTRIHKVVLTPAEEAESIRAFHAKQPPHGLHLAGGRCAACPKILEPEESAIRGYASGEELGLCRACAATVNTPAAIASAALDGHQIKGEVVILRKKRTDEPEPSYEETFEEPE